jgi:hypothetical protein
MDRAAIVTIAALSMLMTLLRGVACAQELQLRGALVFQKANKVVRLDLEGRKAISLGDGEDPYMAENGEAFGRSNLPRITGL